MRKLELKLQAVVAWVFLMRFQSIWVHGFISNSPLSPASPPIAVLEDNPFAPSPGAVVGGGDEDDGHLEMKVLIGLTVVAAVLAYLLVSMICLYISRSSRRLAKGRNRQSDPEQGLSLHKVSSKRSCSNSVGKGKRRVAFVEYETLQSGTNGFSHDSILGGGSLGTVYQAWLEDGSLVAVKRFNAGDADAERQCQLTGFGLAVTANQAQNTESIESSGTPGYVAPEYLQDGKLTDKSDVYAFGVILLELLFGRKAVEELSTGHSQSIVTWAIPQLTDRSKIPSIVDPVIKDTMELKHLYQVAAVAVLCVQPEPSYRPLITDVLYSLAPLVPAELGGSGRGSYVTTTCHGNAT